MIFCLIGLVVFSVASFFLSSLLIVGFLFSLAAIISFDVFLFQIFRTNYFWLKITGLSLIDIIYTIGNIIVFNFISGKTSDNITVQSCIHAFYIFCFIFCSALLIMLFDFLLSKGMHMKKDDSISNSIKLFRFSFVGILLFNCLCITVPLYNIIPLLAIISLAFQIINIIVGIVIICTKAVTNVMYKCLASVFSAFCSLLVMFYFMKIIDGLNNNIITDYQILWYYSFACLLVLIMVFVVAIIMIIQNSFSKNSGIKGSLIAIFISTIAAVFSYILIDEYVIFEFIPDISYIEYLFTGLFAIYVLSVAINVMKIAYLLIFKSTPTKPAPTIPVDDNIDEVSDTYESTSKVNQDSQDIT